MATQDHVPYGVNPEEFGFARVDAAALLDAELGDVDWATPPAGSVTMRVPAPSGDLAALAMGDPEDPWIVLVPGATGSKEDFSLMMANLAAAGYFVLSHDLAGQYESAAAGPENLMPPRRHQDYELLVEDFLAVLGSGGKPAHVVGYSFAAIIAQLAFSKRPDRVRHLRTNSAVTSWPCMPRTADQRRPYPPSAALPCTRRHFIRSKRRRSGGSAANSTLKVARDIWWRRLMDDQFANGLADTPTRRLGS